MKEKTRTTLKSLVVVIAVIGIIAFFAVSFTNGLSSLSDYIIFIPLLIIVSTSTWLVLDRIRNQRKGLKSEDEMTKKISYRAGYNAWIVAIWSAIGSMWYNIFSENTGSPMLDTGQLVAVVVIVSSLVFFGSYFYYYKRGE